MTHTRTMVLMAVPPSAFENIRKQLVDAGYSHALIEGDTGYDIVLDLHGIGIVKALATDEDTKLAATLAEIGKAILYHRELDTGYYESPMPLADIEALFQRGRRHIPGACNTAGGR